VHTRIRAHRIRFGPFEIDLRAKELRKHGSKIHLQPQPFRILVLLLDHHGEIVPRGKLREELWPVDTFVDFNHGLNAAMRNREYRALVGFIAVLLLLAARLYL